MIQSQGKASLKLEGFEALRQGLKRGQHVNVGVFGDHKAERNDNSINNVELALIHEFGSLSAHIPARSFLRMPIQEKRKEILAFAASKPMRMLLLRGEQHKALNLLGIKCEQIIDEAFQTSGWGKWASLKHRIGKILVDTGQLRRSIWHKVVS